LADYVGLEVERVANLLPRWQRDLLVLHYVRKLRPQQIVRALGLRFSEFEAHLRTSALMIDNKLRRNGVDIVLKLSL
jgi:DNA-directed RNA polymerase specialized sigma24 family protein